MSRDSELNALRGKVVGGELVTAEDVERVRRREATPALADVDFAEIVDGMMEAHKRAWTEALTEYLEGRAEQEWDA